MTGDSDADAADADAGGMRPARELTNAFVVDGARVLLGLKKRGFGAGKWNGFGGKLAHGETPLQAAQREILEEAGVQMLDPRIVGRVTYSYEGTPGELLVHVFRATRWAPREPAESEEMRPQWFATDVVPFASMWADDPHWFEHMLKGDCFFTARFDFAEDHKTIINHNVDVVPLAKKGESAQSATE